MINELIKAREKCAQIITQYGDVYLPIFERLDNEISALQTRQSAMDRVRMIADRGTSGNGTRIGTQNSPQKGHHQS